MKDLRSIALLASAGLIGILATRFALQRLDEKHEREMMEGLENFYKDIRRKGWLEYATSGGVIPIPNED